MNKKDRLKSLYQNIGYTPKRIAKPCKDNGHTVPAALFPSNGSESLILSPHADKKAKLCIELKLPAGISLALIIL